MVRHPLVYKDIPQEVDFPWALKVELKPNYESKRCTYLTWDILTKKVHADLGRWACREALRLVLWKKKTLSCQVTAGGGGSRRAKSLLVGEQKILSFHIPCYITYCQKNHSAGHVQGKLWLHPQQAHGIWYMDVCDLRNKYLLSLYTHKANIPQDYT